MNKPIKYLIYFLVGLIVILGIAYVVVMNMPKASTKSVAAEISVSATDLYNEFSTNEQTANQKYIGKIINVEGILTDAFEDELGNPAIILGDANSDLAFVTLYPSEKEKLDKLKFDNKIKIKGVCTGVLTEVTINKAIIVEAQ